MAKRGASLVTHGSRQEPLCRSEFYTGKRQASAVCCVGVLPFTANKRVRGSAGDALGVGCTVVDQTHLGSISQEACLLLFHATGQCKPTQRNAERRRVWRGPCHSNSCHDGVHQPRTCRLQVQQHWAPVATKLACTTGIMQRASPDHKVRT